MLLGAAQIRSEFNHIVLWTCEGLELQVRSVAAPPLYCILGTRLDAGMFRFEERVDARMMRFCIETMIRCYLFAKLELLEDGCKKCLISWYYVKTNSGEKSSREAEV